MSDLRRADVLLYEQQLAPSREQARKLIESGTVTTAEGTPVRKPAEKFSADTRFLCETEQRFVSRGAYKLLPALERFANDLSGRTALDIGASTGGFTDLMLRHGARKVYAVDCGHGQLHPKLLADERVISLEKCNARELTKVQIPESIDIVTMDVSFISVTLIFPALPSLLADDAVLFILVKPQFECGRELLGKNGVVKSEAVRQMCVDKVVAAGESILGRQNLAVLPSPILGPQGNQEFIAVFAHNNL